MIGNWGTASLVEVLWTLMALVGLAAAGAGLVVAAGDLRAVRGGRPPDRHRRLLVARYNRRREAVSAGLQAVFVMVGLRALWLPPNPASDSLGTFLVGAMFFTAAALLTWCSVMDRRDRRRFDRMD